MADIVIQYEPNTKQSIFHASPAEELLYGGAKGGGKSCALVMETLAYALENAGATCYLFRETYDDLEANLINEWKTKVPQELYKYHESKHLATLVNGSKVFFRFVRNEDDAEKYQGRSMDYIGVDELTKHTKRTIQLLLSCLRSPKGFPPRFRGTCNPGGVGHGWVKEDYVLATDYGKKIVRCPITGNRRSFIPAQVYDNHIIMRNDPAYVKRLENLPEQERKAFLYGDWDVFVGQYFSEWRRELHVCQPFALNHGYIRFRAMDWGSSTPYSVGWYAIGYDGIIYKYRELYGIKDGQANVGTKETAIEVARRVKDLEKGEEIAYGVADPKIFSSDNGPSVNDHFAQEGVYWMPADNSRLAGWEQMHIRLKGEKGKPAFKVFENCIHTIRTIPLMLHDKHRVEDVDTNLEDHAPDETRYALMSKPWKPVKEDAPAPDDYGRKKNAAASAWSA